jgi:hypothetical protein
VQQCMPLGRRCDCHSVLGIGCFEWSASPKALVIAFYSLASRKGPVGVGRLACTIRSLQIGVSPRRFQSPALHANTQGLPGERGSRLSINVADKVFCALCTLCRRRLLPPDTCSPRTAQQPASPERPPACDVRGENFGAKDYASCPRPTLPNTSALPAWRRRSSWASAPSRGEVHPPQAMFFCIFNFTCILRDTRARLCPRCVLEAPTAVMGHRLPAAQALWRNPSGGLACPVSPVSRSQAAGRPSTA